MNKTDKAVKVGQIVEYLSYGQSRKGVVCRVTDNGTLFLTNGRFVFPESVLSFQRDAILRNARSNFRKGDTITNYDGRIGHRYAGCIIEFETKEMGDAHMSTAGFTLDRNYDYLPCSVWTV